MKKTFFNRIYIVHIYLLFVILFVVIAGLLLIGSFRAEKSIEDMQTLTNEYVEGQKAINDLMDASDYLTQKARVFVVSGDPENGRLYQEEIDVTKRREKALETLEEFDVKQEAYDALNAALKESNELTETEYYAMLLAAVGNGIDKSVYEEFTGGFELTKHDMTLSKEEKTQKAIGLLFGDEYEEKKAEIKQDVSSSLDVLLEELEGRQLDSYDVATALSRNERFMFSSILIGIFILLLVTALLIIDPISKSTQQIIKNEPLPTKGSAEFYSLAEAYNKMLTQSQMHQKKLSYEATHDELTGLLNRKAFEEKKEELQGEKIAMLILDVDKFKEVNDTYGHETGDRVLKKVGAILSSSFRLEDCVCRIGGDEFAVIMRQMDPSLKHVVREKINGVQEKLLTRDDLPKNTLSIGVAFSDDEGPEENLFKKADKALYSIKEHGRDGYAFYNEL